MLEVVPLGGLGEFGMNMLAITWGETTIVVDAGVMFPDPELLGVDRIIPDFTYLQQKGPSAPRSGRLCAPATSRSIRPPSTASTSTFIDLRSLAAAGSWRSSPTARTSTGAGLPARSGTSSKRSRRSSPVPRAG